MAKKRGRPRKPTTLKIATGTHRKDRDGDPAKEAQGTRLKVNAKPPVSLNRNEMSHWKRTLEILVPKGLATSLDVPAIVTYAKDRWLEQRIRKEIDKHGLLIRARDKGQMKANPLLTTLNQVCSRIAAFESRFGMSPTDRAGLNVDNLDIPAESTGGVASRKRG